MIKRGASDLHLSAGSPPYLRVAGVLQRVEDRPTLSAEDTRRYVDGLLVGHPRERLVREKDVSFTLTVPGLARFRASVYSQRGALSLVVRVVPSTIPSLDALGLPPAAAPLIRSRQGLVVVAGYPGSGRSTTLAALLELINTTSCRHVITIEDPIEFAHSNKRSLIEQREIGSDTPSYEQALGALLRQDCDVVMIDDLRDQSSIRSALTLADTGHLVLATISASSCAEAVRRIVDAFPPTQQPDIRIQLSLVIEGVLSQTLVPKVDGGRVLAVEVLLGTTAIRSVIREGAFPRLHATMQTGTQVGMQTLNQALGALVSRGVIGREEAMTHSPIKEELAQFIRT
jgi:twitching motility protein PilT